MARSKSKGPFLDKGIINKFNKSNESPLFLTTVKRDSEILPIFTHNKVKVHNGQKYSSILITEQMVGHKFGEFAFTRKQYVYKRKKIKKRKKK